MLLWVGRAQPQNLLALILKIFSKKYQSIDRTISEQRSDFRQKESSRAERSFSLAGLSPVVSKTFISFRISCRTSVGDELTRVRGEEHGCVKISWSCFNFVFLEISYAPVVSAKSVCKSSCSFDWNKRLWLCITVATKSDPVWGGMRWNGQLKVLKVEISNHRNHRKNGL